jgi:hypothetical protein
LFSALFALWIHYVFHCPKSKNYIENIPSYIQKLKYQESIFAFCVAFALPYLSTKENSRNVFANELQAAFINFILLLCTAN